MTLITLELVRDKWYACYKPERLAALFDRPHTPVEVLTRKDGPWADVPAKDRLWTVCHEGVLTDRTLRHFAADCAERALFRERGAGREPDTRSWAAIEAARKYADGLIGDHELKSAWQAAYASAVAAVADEPEWQVSHLLELIEKYEPKEPANDHDLSKV